MAMSAGELADKLQELIDSGEISADYKVEYQSFDFLGRCTADELLLDPENKAILICEERSYERPPNE